MMEYKWVVFALIAVLAMAGGVGRFGVGSRSAARLGRAAYADAGAFGGSDAQSGDTELDPPYMSLAPGHPTSETAADSRFTDYDELYLAILAITDGPGYDTGFDALSKPAQAMYVVALFDMEIQNGGLCQFFVNCGARLDSWVSDSLRLVGLEPMGALYASFLSEHRIGSADLAAFQGGSVDEYLALNARYPFGDFDDAYLRLWDELGFCDVMLRYANAHAEVFGLR